MQSSSPTCITYLRELYFFADQARVQHQSFWQWIIPSSKTINRTLSIVGELAKIWLYTREPQPIVQFETHIHTEQRKTVDNEKAKKQEEEEKNRKREQNIRVVVGVSSVLGMFGLSHLISKDSAKVKSAKEIEDAIDLLEQNINFWMIGTDEKEEFIQNARNLVQKVQRNTTNLKIVPNVFVFVGCVFGLIGSVYKSTDLMKGGGLFAIGGITIKIIVNSYFSNADQEIYQLADKVCVSARCVVFPAPSAPKFDE